MLQDDNEIFPNFSDLITLMSNPGNLENFQKAVLTEERIFKKAAFIAKTARMIDKEAKKLKQSGLTLDSVSLKGIRRNWEFDVKQRIWKKS